MVSIIDIFMAQIDVQHAFLILPFLNVFGLVASVVGLVAHWAWWLAFLVGRLARLAATNGISGH